MAASPIPATSHSTDQALSVVLVGLRKAVDRSDFFDDIASQLRELGRPYHLVLVDDGSGLAGSAVAEAARAGVWLEVVRHAGRRSVGAQMQTGLRAAVRHGGVVLTVTAEESRPPKLQTLLERIEAGYDVVIASRFVPPRSSRQWSTALAASVAGVEDRGSTCRAYRAATLEQALRTTDEQGVGGPVPWPVRLLRAADNLGARIAEVPLTAAIPVKLVTASAPPTAEPSVAVTAARQVRHADWACRLLSVAVATVAIVLTAPLMLVIGGLIKLTSAGPIMYTQPRIGADRRARHRLPENCRRRVNYCGRPFRIYKFRTMFTTSAGGPTDQVWAQPQDPRVTPIGRFLRKYRLDELPQMFNVLWGDMNIVGPRPEQPGIVMDLREQIDRYDERHRVPPGITGWAQINQHYDSSIDDVRRKVFFDLEYVARRSALEDLRIMLRTLPVMLFQRGAW